VLLSPRSVKLIGFQVSKSGAKGKPLNSGCTDDFLSGDFSERYRPDSVYKWHGKADLFHRLKIISARSYKDHLNHANWTFCDRQKRSRHANSLCKHDLHLLLDPLSAE
jgi:hypothetical protein